MSATLTKLRFQQIATAAVHEFVPETDQMAGYYRTVQWLYGLDFAGRVWFWRDGEWIKLEGQDEVILEEGRIVGEIEG